MQLGTKCRSSSKIGVVHVVGECSRLGRYVRHTDLSQWRRGWCETFTDNGNGNENISNAPPTIDRRHEDPVVAQGGGGGVEGKPCTKNQIDSSSRFATVYSCYAQISDSIGSTVRLAN